MSFRRGEVHGLVGANGAGKSTFLNIIGGVIPPSSGSLLIDGTEMNIGGPREAAALGFSFIPQELSVVPGFSAIDNIALGMRSASRWGFVDERKRAQIARAVADRLAITFDLRKPVRELSVAERGLVVIAHALARDVRFIAMDEPTSSLSEFECNRLFEVVRELARGGVSVAYVSHRLEEIEQLSDRVTVFRDGRVVGRFERGAYHHEELFEGITGKATERLTIEPSERAADHGDVLFGAAHLADGRRVKDVTFDCRAGEIVGLGGLVGAGRTETLKLIFGELRPVSGKMSLNGHEYTPRSVRDAVSREVALVPEERRSQGLVMDESVFANVVLGNWTAMRMRTPLPFISESRAREVTSSMVTTLDIRVRQVGEAVRTLSGGNQQKVVFARWLSRNSRLLLLDEPTRGVDVGARQQIWRTVEELASQGKAVVVVSSELGELVSCHRIFVMVEGRTVAELPGPGITEDEILCP